MNRAAYSAASSYLFKHALVQDAAYSTLLRGRRQELHARVAAAMEEPFADLVERQPELPAPSPDRCRQHRTRGRSMAQGRPACRVAVGPFRGDRAFPPGSIIARKCAIASKWA